MFMSLFVLGVILLMIGILLYSKDYMIEGGFAIGCVGAAFMIVGGIFGIASIEEVVESKYIDDRIVMYQEENEEIENDIELIVSQYMNYEQDTFDMSEINSPTTLVQMYPELKSNTLVQQQIELYTSNNQEIKSLKNEEIDCNRAKWLLYFGGK